MNLDAGNEEAVWKRLNITALEKKEQENLTDAEKNVLKKLVKALRDEASNRRRSYE